jgi:glycosyltransferase involved in cell wall biosynthesis
VKALTVLAPGDLDARTGGYEYDRRIVDGLRALGWRVDVVALDDSFPFPTASARAAADRAFASIPDGALALVDGLAYGALPEEAERHAPRLRIVTLVHHPLAAETGLAPPVAASLEVSERRALAAARGVIVTGRATATVLERRYGVAADRIAVVEPGTDPAPLARGSRPLSLLCVATLTPRKGHEILLRALVPIRDAAWRLTCAGSVDRDSATAARVQALIRELGFDGRVTLAGDLDAARLAAEYHRADIFVLPTRYEGYGMAVAEALARGLPVVSTATGAIAGLVGDAAGLVVAPGDVATFAAALERVVRDAPLRARFAAGARSVRDRLPTWETAARSMARVLGRWHE